jgi:hypothetical protein
VSDQTPPEQASTPPPADPGQAAAPDHDFVAPVAPEALPLSTTATRGKHFGEVVSSTLNLILTGLVALIAVIAGASQGVIIAGIGGAVVVGLISLLICFLIAGSRARSDFYTAYADGRKLARSNGRTSLPPVTALLQRGDERYAEEAFSGGLPGGLQGQLALYTYEEETRDSDGNKETTYYHFTVAITNLPETAPFMSELAMQRRSGFRFLDGAEDKFRKRQRVEVESEAADKKYEIFIGPDDSMIKARQIFSPKFIVWMAENAPDGIACELLGGGLCVNVKGHKKTADELDEFCVAASAIAKRLHEEAAEMAGAQGS